MTDLSRLMSLAAGTTTTTPTTPTTQAPPMTPPPVAPRQFYISMDGTTPLKTETELVALFAARPELLEAPIVLASDSAGGWKTAAVYGLKPAPLAPPVAPPAPPAPPVAPAAPAAAVAPVVAQVEVIREVQAEVMPAATTNAVTVSQPNYEVALPSDVNSDADAEAVLMSLGAPVTRTLSEVVSDATMQDGGGMSHSLPFAQLKTGNWTTHKDMDPKIADYMPAGKREWTAIYLGARIGGTGWIGAGSKTAGGNPPAWRFALPHIKGNPEAPEYITECIKHARNLQFTKAAEREKYDAVGRLSPDLHILCWKPGVGFCLLTCSTYGTVTSSLDALGEAEAKGLTGAPLSFSIRTEHQENKKVLRNDPTAKNGSWDTDYVFVQADGSEKGVSINQAWLNYVRDNKQEAGRTMLGFYRATDFTGLSLAAVKDLFTKLNEIPGPARR